MSEDVEWDLVVVGAGLAAPSRQPHRLVTP